MDRWYRGQGGPETSLRFRPFNQTSALNGHDCIDFKPGTYWLVFATERDLSLELVDDCHGAVAVSQLLGPVLEHADVIAQLDADFAAGLEDSDQQARFFSIQRLGGLRSASSRAALHRVIASGNSTERKWAVYAALRTGDTSILGGVRDLFVYGDSDLPLTSVCWELSRLKDRSAIPGLVDIIESSPDSYARASALVALVEKIRSAEALPVIAAHLTDPDPHVRYSALVGMGTITHQPSCTLEPGWTEDMIEPKIRRCIIWWKDVGKLQSSDGRL